MAKGLLRAPVLQHGATLPSDPYQGKIRMAPSEHENAERGVEEFLIDLFGTTRGVAMDNATNTLVTDIAHDVLAELAPQELPILPAATRAYFADPAAALKQSRSKDSALGFGVDAFVFFTPVVLPVLSEVFEFLTQVAKKAVEAGLAKEIPEIIKGMFRKFHSSEPGSPAVLTTE
jgi:hypothetical protein